MKRFELPANPPVERLDPGPAEDDLAHRVGPEEGRVLPGDPDPPDPPIGVVDFEGGHESEGMRLQSFRRVVRSEAYAEWPMVPIDRIPQFR